MILPDSRDRFPSSHPIRRAVQELPHATRGSDLRNCACAKLVMRQSAVAR